MNFSLLWLCVDDHCVQKNIFVADLTEELVTSPAQALAWIRKGESRIWCYCHTWVIHTERALQTVTTNVFSAHSASVENRHYGKTKMNQRSSRSHTIFRMVSNTTTYSNVQDSGKCGFLIILVVFFVCFFFSDPGESREKWPSVRGKRWRSHYRVSFGKLVPIIGLFSTVCVW